MGFENRSREALNALPHGIYRDHMRLHDDMLAEIDRLKAELELVREASGALVDEIYDLMNESDGVAGLHLNGDVADWDELVPGGRFERLSSLEDVNALVRRERDELAAKYDELDPWDQHLLQRHMIAAEVAKEKHE